MSFFGNTVINAGVADLDSVNKALAEEVAQVFLDLGIAHVDAVHDLGLPSAILAYF